VANFKNLSWHRINKVYMDCTEAMEKSSMYLLLYSTVARLAYVNEPQAIDAGEGYHVVITTNRIPRRLEGN
jgi:hypothetical protein